MKSDDARVKVGKKSSFNNAAWVLVGVSARASERASANHGVLPRNLLSLVWAANRRESCHRLA